MTVIRKCKCTGTKVTEYQDNKYGKGNRVMNVTLKKNHRCTACGTETKAEGTK